MQSFCSSFVKRVSCASVFALATLLPTLTHAAEPLKIGYSDWPGYVAWQVAIEKGWFKEAGVDVKFDWFDYSASLDAFTAGKIDADLTTNGDALVIAKPGIKSLKDLKGKKIGLETGLVEHLLLLNGLQKAGMKESDVTIVNTKTNDTPQALASPDIAAIAAWQPNSGQAMKLVPGAKPIYTSAQAPGLIYDVLAVSPTSLSARKDDWAKVIKVWGKVVAYVNDPKTQPDALKIMSARVGLTPEAYKPLLKGTRLLNLAENKATFVKADGLKSLYGSTKVADDFNVKNAIYKEPQDLSKAIDPQFNK